MLKALIVLAMLAGDSAFAGPIPPSPSSGINNSAVPQNAQFNVGTGTIRGLLTVDRIHAHSINLDIFSAASLEGDGSLVTNLNASQLLSGTVSSGRLTGAYTGITGIGTITVGVWHGDLISPQYGGTGKNWSAIPAGNIPVFTGTGIMGTLAAGPATQLLQSTGSGFSWTGVPAILGTNILDIPLAHLLNGELPMTIQINDASISTVSAVKIKGDISGKAAGLYNLLPISGLAGGTLPTTIPASSVTPTGVLPGVYGDWAHAPQITVGVDGRLRKVSSFLIPGISTTGASIIREVPDGPVDGINDTFYLSTGCYPGSESVYVNGGIRNSGVTADYILDGFNKIVFNADAIPYVGSIILVTFTPNTTQTLIPVQSVASGPWKTVRYIEYNSTTGEFRITYQN